MLASDVACGVNAVLEIARAVNLSVDDASVVQNSNKLSLRLRPCDVLARVAFAGTETLSMELELAQLLGGADGPVVAPDPRVEPRVYEHDGFAATFWTYYEQAGKPVEPTAYAKALERLHARMASLSVSPAHFTDRVAEAEQLIANHEQTPSLPAADRELLKRTLRVCKKAVTDGAAGEQLLHGEPHPGNLLNTISGPLFIDLETCCRGPVEFDLAHVPERVAACYSGADDELLNECRGLVLAMVAAWRWELGDQYPDGKLAGEKLVAAVRAGPPWPTVDVAMNGNGRE